MTKALQICDVYDEHSCIDVLPTEIISFLASYNLIGQFLSQSIIESAIAPITCTQAETSHALEQLELFATRKLRVEKFKEITWGHQI